MLDFAQGPSQPETTSAPGANDREFRFTDGDFRKIAAILYTEAGINLAAGKSPLVYGRLVKRLRELKLADFADYVAILERPEATEERGQLVAALTTNVTRFFREPHHFDHLRQAVLAPLMAGARQGARIRIWSSACSTGQEPYSIAAVVANMLPNAGRLDIKILATDIDPNVLEHARAGRYDTVDGVPAGLRRCFRRDGNEWQADASIKELITFRQLNLNAKWPMRGPFDAVFCRNVAIYFDHEVQGKLWNSFAQVMHPNSYLYIGHSERVTGKAAERFETAGITTYRRADDRT